MNSDSEKQLVEGDFLDVCSEYEASLGLPQSNPASQFFLCPVGLIGSGKTTVMKALSQSLSLLRISGDEIRKILYDRGFGYDKTWDIASSLVRKFAHEGYSIANDTDGATLKTREALENLAKELGAKVIYIHIYAPEEVIIKRLKNRKSWLFKDGQEALDNYYARKPLHQNLSLPYIYTFDTSRTDMEGQIEEAITLIYQATNNV